MNLKSTNISLYVHIPFCSNKCKYCDFYSETDGFNRIPLVVTQIINQLDFWLNKLGSPNITTIFIGGGTPSILPIDELDRLLKHIDRLTPNRVEWSIESNPESITDSFLNCCNRYGVSRLSIGVQSINNATLNVLGRRVEPNRVVDALKLVKKYWRGQFSLDFITSVPNQSREMVLNDINFAIQSNPDHISFYALSLEDGTKLEDEVSKGIIEELEPKKSEDLWLYGRELLKNAGYINYEVSNYTKSTPCLHNINYWELKPYLGIGPGAVSTLIDKDNQIIRVSNKKSINEFLKGRESNWGEEYERLNPEEFLEDYIIMGLRLKRGINRKRFKNIFNVDIWDVIPISKKLEEDGVISTDSDFYKFSKRGFNIMNTFLVEILDSIKGVKIRDLNWFY
ncbi:radical SAM family heme chaperone HemW [Thiospirochaeta perfilievii]|nr:radical SAM family heme chaperone HemW [Thiospirochaeta perfilievii]